MISKAGRCKKVMKKGYHTKIRYVKILQKCIYHPFLSDWKCQHLIDIINV